MTGAPASGYLLPVGSSSSSEPQDPALSPGGSSDLSGLIFLGAIPTAPSDVSSVCWLSGRDRRHRRCHRRRCSSSAARSLRRTVRERSCSANDAGGWPPAPRTSSTALAGGAHRRVRPPPRTAIDQNVDQRLGARRAASSPRTELGRRHRDPRAARQGRQRRGADARPRQGPVAPRAGATPAEGARRLRRAAAREPPARPAARIGVRDPAHVLVRRPRRRGRPGRAADLRSTRSSRSTTIQRLVEAESRRRAAARTRRRSRAMCATTSTPSPRKYIRPEEGTYDFAFMYVPVEAVYYELACGRERGRPLQYAHEKRVFPVSPSTFTAYLQVIVLGLRGMQIEQRAGEVMAYVAELEPRLREVRPSTSTRRHPSRPRPDEVRRRRQAARAVRRQARAAERRGRRADRARRAAHLVEDDRRTPSSCVTRR